MGTIDDEARIEMVFGELSEGKVDGGRIVIWFMFGTPKDNMDTRIAARLGPADAAFRIEAELGVGLLGGYDPKNRRFKKSQEILFEADRKREARGHLPIDLGS